MFSIKRSSQPGLDPFPLAYDITSEVGWCLGFAA